MSIKETLTRQVRRHADPVIFSGLMAVITAAGIYIANDRQEDFATSQPDGRTYTAQGIQPPQTIESPQPEQGELKFPIEAREQMARSRLSSAIDVLKTVSDIDVIKDASMLYELFMNDKLYITYVQTPEIEAFSAASGRIQDTFITWGPKGLQIEVTAQFLLDEKNNDADRGIMLYNNLQIYTKIGKSNLPVENIIRDTWFNTIKELAPLGSEVKNPALQLAFAQYNSYSTSEESK